MKSMLAFIHANIIETNCHSWNGATSEFIGKLARESSDHLHSLSLHPLSFTFFDFVIDSMQMELLEMDKQRWYRKSL